MQYFGEIAALGVAVSWSASALFFEFAGKRIGSVTVNLLKLLLTIFFIGIILVFATGSFIATGANANAWLWLALSGAVGFTICDLCLFYAYVSITSRFSQLIMTAYPPFAAIAAWVILDEKMPAMGAVGMIVTMIGVAISIFKRNSNGGKLSLSLPLKGVACACIGAVCQGVGLVLSKQGMIYYAQSESLSDMQRSLIPFAATQIRAIIGAVGFFLILLFTRKLYMIRSAMHDRQGLGYTFGGSMFGPFIGVSLSLLAIQSASTGVVSTIMATTPIILLANDAIFRKKRISKIEIIGAILSVVGVSLFFV